MNERCIVRVKFTPAGAGSEVRRAVGGFLRYVQHRDVHLDSKPPRSTSEVAGLLKYVAYRDKANARAELFGPHGAVGTRERKEFADFVARSIEGSDPQVFRTRDGRSMDRRRAVSRFVISPERAHGLDLEALTRAAVASLEAETGVIGMRWIAAVHRNTQHHHVHLVLAGMHENGSGGYRRVDISKPRLAAIKEAVKLEIDRQRESRVPSKQLPTPLASGTRGGKSSLPALPLQVLLPEPIRTPPLAPLARFRVASSGDAAVSHPGFGATSSLLRLRAMARRYQRLMQRQAEEEARRLGWERAA